MDLHKLAQRKSLLNKIREKTNVSGIAAEKFFNPEFKEVMETLREADDLIWAIVKGEADGDVSLKELIKSARSNFNRREYITAVNFLGRFHKRVDDVVKEIKKLNFKVDQVHHEFLFKDLDQEQQGHLEALKNRFAEREYSLKKEAGIADLLSNLTSTRGRALSAWEKRYPDRVKKFKNDTKSLLDNSEKMFNIVQEQLHEMGKEKADRRVDDYMKAANKIAQTYGKYDSNFKTVYSANIKSFVNDFFARKKEMESKLETSKPGGAELDIPIDVVSPPTGKEERPTAPDLNPEIKNRDISHHPDAAIDPDAEKLYQEVGNPGHKALKPAKTPDLGELEEEEKEGTPDTLRAPPPKTDPGKLELDGLDQLPSSKAEHQKFVSFLETLGSEDPRFLTRYITRYAAQIEETDPEASIQLLQIAKKIGG